VRHPQLTYEQSSGKALKDADAVVLLTEWPEYCEMNPEVVGEVTRGRIIVDGRNVLDPGRWRAAGWTYAGIGRP
jgi:UDPglucose 6-dehydrogenase